MQKIAFSLLLFFCCLVRVQANDSLTLAQSYINLSLTVEYFDSLSADRVSRILPFLDGELKGISNQKFRQENQVLLLLSEAQLQFLEAKHSFVNRKSLTRPQLLQWKAKLDSAHLAIKKLEQIKGLDNWQSNQYYKLIGVTEENLWRLNYNIENLQKDLSPLINQDIYPDFKRIYFYSKNQNEFYFDSLQYFTGIYGLELDFETLLNSDFPKDLIHSSSSEKINSEYQVAQALHLISQYLQLDYILKKANSVESTLSLRSAINGFEFQMNLEDRNSFRNGGLNYSADIPKDDFFLKEFTIQKLTLLRENLLKKFNDYEEPRAGLVFAPRPDIVGGGIPSDNKFYFPKVAPFPSSKIAIPDFLPTTEQLGDVDKHIRKSFEAAGYQGRLHYFYLHEPGFAVTTAIERIKKDGSPISPEDTRWNLRGNPSGSFSLYQVFRSIFFATESDFRIIACVVSAAEARTGSEQGSFGFFTKLLENSYSTLPKDLRNMKLKDKTLTILVYHFFQSDIGQVPVLDRSKRLTVNQHLEKTRNLRNLTAN